MPEVRRSAGNPIAIAKLLGRRLNSLSCLQVNRFGIVFSP
jgi:hypothetical protein